MSDSEAKPPPIGEGAKARRRPMLKSERKYENKYVKRLIATRPECPYILRPYSYSEERPSGRGQSAGCFLATSSCL
ncbi:hypothetical protein I3842_Q009800 [Carya illinoinensis]|uniref:Uncharacterized protein n=1 Tax=Carya illinoinensis TaxID=32201 RepID=A0A922A520_CARIL|nr:hypothetical protein I3842_Q009800 [Carya illinoinensis]